MMKDSILSYREMCDLEKVQTLQRGMNYRLNASYSVILMSQRKNAPYKDKVYSDGITIEYEGHDVPKTSDSLQPKHLDQQASTSKGSLTQNGLFVKAIEEFKNGFREAEIVRVYEKILPGIWSEKGFFKLIDYNYVNDDFSRKVFRFVLEELDSSFINDFSSNPILKERSRVIPGDVKKIVWKRDGGSCVLCGAKDELHFDHDLPFSLGGTSITPENVKILCARHNLKKSNKIE